MIIGVEAVSVRDFGAVGDGETDDTAAFQRAIDMAAARGNTLHIPAGRYAILDDVSIESSVRLRGDSDRRSIITSNGERARLLVAGSGIQIQDIGFEDMVEPIALVSRKDFILEGVRIERCRFERITIWRRNRGVIGLSSGNSSQRVHRIHNLIIKDCFFREIDAHAVNVRGNLTGAQVTGNFFAEIVNRRGEEEKDAMLLGGFAIRLGESSDDSEALEEFAGQGQHRVEGNFIQGMRKQTVRGNLIGVLLYGNHNVIRENTIEDIDGTPDGMDTNAIYVRGAFNKVIGNRIRSIRGADDDGALCFKGGLELGSRDNIVAYNRIESVTGMSAVEVSSSRFRFTGNEIMDASLRGFRHRAGEELLVENNLFRTANTDLRTQKGKVTVSGNDYIDSIIWISQRDAHPSSREGVHISGNRFLATRPETGAFIRLGNDVEERLVSIRDNAFIVEPGVDREGPVVNLETNGRLQRVEIVGNRMRMDAVSEELFRTNSPEEIVSGNVSDAPAGQPGK